MREIKFRAWDRKRKEMFQVHQMEYSRIDHSLNNVVGYTDAGGSWWNQHGGGNSMYANEFRYILMQYTGLKDKNGREIYEGDIFKTSLGHLAVVEWDAENGRFLAFTATRRIMYVGREPAVEVIGNIYENPELLEVRHESAQ